MKSVKQLWVACVLVMSSATASASEPTLTSILNGIGTGWSAVSFEQILGADWNHDGTELSFALVSENTSWASWQTFSILDGRSSHREDENEDGHQGKLIFGGSDTNGATKAYTLHHLLTGVDFAETKRKAEFKSDKMKIFVNATGSMYAFAHEDWNDRDYNDMVVSMTVTAVPEPETAALILVGLGLVGWSSRRKQG